MEEKVVEELAEVIPATAGGEDLFVEVGNRVTYCLMDDPNDRHRVLIVDSPSNAKMGIINEQTPLAQALLGLSPGDVGVLDNRPLWLWAAYISETRIESPRIQ